MKPRLGIRQRFVLDEASDDRGYRVPLERLQPLGKRWSDVLRGFIPFVYTHDVVRVGFKGRDIEPCGYWDFFITTEVEL